MKLFIRKAKLADKSAISRLTKKYPDTLARSAAEIGKMIANFWVAESPRGKIVGCCGWKLWSGDAEIISWVVEKKYRKYGAGKKILLALLRDLRRKKTVKNIFAVTVPPLAQKYFEPLGFLPTGLQMFSEKVISDCKRCPKNIFRNKKYQCNEIALVLKNRR